MSCRALLVAAVVALLPGVAGAAECGPLRLVELAAEAGIEFQHDRGAAGAKRLPETMGAGLAWLDYDGDGWLDLYLVQSGSFPPDGSARAADRLFRNLGGGRFAEVSERAGLADRQYGQGAVAADVDGDGDADLLVTGWGGLALVLNAGDGRFEPASADSAPALDGWASSSALADADGDGDLDLYVTRYLEYDPEHGLFCGDPETGERSYCDPSLFLGAGDRYFENLGGGRFADATSEAGLATADGRGLGVVFTDLDGDGRPDLYVANDLTLNFLFRNVGGGRFEDLSLVSGTAVNGDGKPEAGMGVAVGDVDGDLDPELAVTNFDVETNTLYLNLGGAVFQDVSAPSGFGPPSFNRLAFGLVAADFDRDGALDYFIGNGHIFERPKRDNTGYRQPDQLLVGDGAGGFREAGCPALSAAPEVTRGVAAADYDNDGDPDVATLANGGPFRLYDNRPPPAGWLGVIAHGAAPNTAAVGLRATLVAGARRQARWLTAGDSYQSSSDPRLLFGLGPAAPARLELNWPTGSRRLLLQPPADRYLVVPELPSPR